MTTRKSTLAGLMLLAGTGAALAREPGVPSSVPPGNTMGVAIGANPPPGTYFNSRTGMWDGELKDDHGDDAGQTNTLIDTALQFIWVPETPILGGSYRAMITVPFLYNDQDRTSPFPPPLQGSASDFGLGPVEISPLGVSWQFQPGIFASAALNFYTPVADFDPDAAINVGGDFWSIAPMLGFSYLRDGWNLSASAAYFVNAENRTSEYRSGDELLINATAFKDVGGWSVGPVGYWRKQTTSDRNNGTYYGGTIQDKAEQAAVGLGVERSFGMVQANVNVTTDVFVRNTVGGNKLWLNFSLPVSGL